MAEEKAPTRLNIGKWTLERDTYQWIVSNGRRKGAKGPGSLRNPSYHSTLEHALRKIGAEVQVEVFERGEFATLEELMQQMVAATEAVLGQVEASSGDASRSG